MQFIRLFVLLALICSGCADPVTLPGDYSLHRNSAHDVYISRSSWRDESERIPPKVVGVWYDERYIIAEREPFVRRSPDNPQDHYLIPSGVTEFWILDVTIGKSFGPLTADELNEIAKKLGLPHPVRFHSL